MNFIFIELGNKRYGLTLNYTALAEFWERKDGTLTVNYTESFQKLSIEDQIICYIKINKKFQKVKVVRE